MNEIKDPNVIIWGLFAKLAAAHTEEWDAHGSATTGKFLGDCCRKLGSNAIATQPPANVYILMEKPLVFTCNLKRRIFEFLDWQNIMWRRDYCTMLGRLLVISYVKWAPYHHLTARPQVTIGQISNVLNFLVWKPKGDRLFWNRRCNWIDIKTDVKKRNVEVGRYIELI
jgi:hypothetical protein